MKSPYLYLLKHGFSEVSVYSIDFLLSIFQSIGLIGTTIFMWTVIFPAYSGQTLSERTAYLLLANGISLLIGSTRFRLGKDINRLIQKGLLSRYLLRPLNPLWQIISEQFGIRLQEYIIGAISILLSLFFMPSISIEKIPLFLLLVVFGITSATALNIIIGAMAFFLTDADGIVMTTVHFTRLLNGIHIPLTIVKETLGAFAGQIMIVLPFAAMAFTPAHYLTTTGPLNNEDIGFILSCFSWGALLPIFAVLIWKVGLKKYEAVGA